MVKRYPHSATINIIVVTVTAGEYASSAATTQVIEGRLERAPIKVKNAAGDWVDVKGRFFTRQKKIANADSLTLSGRTYKITEWLDYQTASQIWLD